MARVARTLILALVVAVVGGGVTPATAAPTFERCTAAATTGLVRTFVREYSRGRVTAANRL